MGPEQYIRERRLTRAAALLAASPVSVKEAMAVAGFNDPSHFSRDYKRRFGAAPGIRRERSQVVEGIVNDR